MYCFNNFRTTFIYNYRHNRLLSPPLKNRQKKEWYNGIGKNPILMKEDQFMSIKKGTMPPRYDEAFKAGAVKMVTEQGRPVKEVAAELGICIDTLSAWLNVRVMRLPLSAGKAALTAAAVNSKQKTVLCANSLPRKTRSLLS